MNNSEYEKLSWIIIHYSETTEDHFMHLSDPELVQAEMRKFYHNNFGNQ